MCIEEENEPTAVYCTRTPYSSGVDIVQTKDISDGTGSSLQVPRINHFKFTFCYLITRIKFGPELYIFGRCVRLRSVYSMGENGKN